jgi:hypothetical protein
MIPTISLRAWLQSAKEGFTKWPNWCLTSEIRLVFWLGLWQNPEAIEALPRNRLAMFSFRQFNALQRK